MRATVLAMVILIGGCSGAVDGPPTLELTEFAIDATGTWEAGRLTIEGSNLGEFAHTIVVAEPSGEVVAASDVIEPGESVEMDVDLSPGEFQITCRIVVQTSSGAIVDHFERGMLTNIEIPE